MPHIIQTSDLRSMELNQLEQSLSSQIQKKLLQNSSKILMSSCHLVILSMSIAGAAWPSSSAMDHRGSRPLSSCNKYLAQQTEQLQRTHNGFDPNMFDQTGIWMFLNHFEPFKFGTQIFKEPPFLTQVLDPRIFQRSHFCQKSWGPGSEPRRATRRPYLRPSGTKISNDEVMVLGKGGSHMLET